MTHIAFSVGGSNCCGCSQPDNCAGAGCIGRRLVVTVAGLSALDAVYSKACARDGENRIATFGALDGIYSGPVPNIAAHEWSSSAIFGEYMGGAGGDCFNHIVGPNPGVRVLKTCSCIPGFLDSCYDTYSYQAFFSFAICRPCPPFFDGGTFTIRISFLSFQNCFSCNASCGPFNFFGAEATGICQANYRGECFGTATNADGVTLSARLEQ